MMHPARNWGSDSLTFIKDINNLAERFWRRVHIAGTDECWEWSGSLANGTCRFLDDNRRLVAQRVAYELWYGPIPEGYWIRHCQKNPKCVNPAHLKAMPPAEVFNTKEAQKNIRAAKPRGAKHPNAKLTEEDVIAIKALRRRGISLAQLRELFGVSHCTIERVLYGQSWK